MVKKIKERTMNSKQTPERGDLNIQKFMNDMQMIGNQVRKKDLIKPNFNYGDLSVTNYLLWLMLAELMILNNKNGGG